MACALYFEGPLPGIRVEVMMGETPYPWTDCAARQGYPRAPEPVAIASLFGYRAGSGPDYEDGARGAQLASMSAIPVEADDTELPGGSSCIDYVRRAASGPFVAHLSILRPHPPFIAPELLQRACTIRWPSVPGFARLATPDGEAAQHPWLAHQLSRRLFRAPSDEKKLCRLKAVYYGLMSEVDAALGRSGIAQAALKQSGRLWDDTLIIFTSRIMASRCGRSLAAGRSAAISMRPTAFPPLDRARDPRAAADARARTGGAAASPRITLDIMPTPLLEAIGRLTSAAMRRGVAARRFLEGRDAPANWRTEAHWEFDFRNPADDRAERALALTLHQCTMNIVRDARFKYVHFTKLPPLFFDLEKDPGEFINRAYDPAYLPLVLEYAQKRLSWRMNHDEQTLTQHRR